MMDVFNEKVAEAFHEELPEMPCLAGESEMEIKELDRETFNQFHAAGETLSPDIVRFLRNRKPTEGAGGAKKTSEISIRH